MRKNSGQQHIKHPNPFAPTQNKPPTAGFVGKLYIFSGAFSLSDSDPFYLPMVWLAVIGVINTAISAAYYLRIVAAPYMGRERIEGPGA